MEMSSTVEWALHCAFLLAQLPDDQSISGRQLSEFYDLPPPYLSKVLKAMVANGLLVASSGPKGGYRLARDAEQITVLELVQAIDGPNPAFRCAEIRQRGPVGLTPEQCRRACGINGVMQRAERAWRHELAEVTLAELVTDAGPASRQRANRWLTSAERQPDGSA